MIKPYKKLYYLLFQRQNQVKKKTLIFLETDYPEITMQLTGSINMVPGGPAKPSAPGRPGRPGGPYQNKGMSEMAEKEKTDI